MTDACVLYVDHQGHPAPLLECFHATASRRLSSTVDRQRRPSTVTQVDSAYCPYSFGFQDASSASRVGFCEDPACLRCPMCTSRISVSILSMDDDSGKKEVGLKCGFCSWTSQACDLTVPVAQEDVAKKEVIQKALQTITESLKERRERMDTDINRHYGDLIAAWEGILKPQKSSQERLGRKEEAWSVETLEDSLQQKKGPMEVLFPVAGLHRISLDEEQSLDPSLQDQPVLSLALQSQTSPAVPKSMTDLLPLPVPLRARTSRRCRAELAEGRPGILLKPKLNPLEGDSSLRSGHGQWWKKDSSAIHVVPRVRVVRYGCSGSEICALLLKVTNPSLGNVRLRLSPSTYCGESHWDPQPEMNTSLENLLIESLSNKHVNAELLVAAFGKESETIELESAEDAFVGLGKSREMTPEVENWDAATVSSSFATSGKLESLEPGSVAVTIRLLANKSGSAWFELIAQTRESKSQSGNYTAIPLALQIEVGNGSWESSLIKPDNSSEQGENGNLVTFDLVITWPRQI